MSIKNINMVKNNFSESFLKMNISESLLKMNNLAFFFLKKMQVKEYVSFNIREKVNHRFYE